MSSSVSLFHSTQHGTLAEFILQKLHLQIIFQVVNPSLKAWERER
jgi:hypothetical protein